MRDIMVTDIPENDYRWLCEMAEQRGITAGQFVKMIIAQSLKEAGQRQTPSERQLSQPA